jgi:hypothetical protein
MPDDNVQHSSMTSRRLHEIACRRSRVSIRWTRLDSSTLMVDDNKKANEPAAGDTQGCRIGEGEMAQEQNASKADRRRWPRYPTRHRVQEESLDGQISVRGILDDLSASGCALRLNTFVPPGTMIEAQCDVSGIGLRVYGKVVWAEQTGTGVLQGVTFAEFASEEDALFHRLYVSRLARQASSPPEAG